MAKKKIDDIKEELTRATSKKDRGTVFISTGSTISDLVLGCGNGLGVETGSVINIAGRSGGGKSQLIMSIIACANRDYGNRLKKKLLDSENGSNFETEEIYGFSFEEGEVSACRTIEEAHSDINVFLNSVKPDEIGLFALDSIDGLIGSETDEAIDDRVASYEKGKDYEGKTYGMGKAKYLSTTMLPDLANKFVNKNSLWLVASQVRDNPNKGLYGAPDIISNGRAMLFYSHVQLWIKKKQGIEHKGKEIGSVVEYTIKKGRGARAFRSCLVTIYYTMGIDSIASDVDYLFDLRSAQTGELLARANKETEWNGKTFNGREELINYIDENDLTEELKLSVVRKWDAEEEEALAPIAGRKNRYMK